MKAPRTTTCDACGAVVDLLLDQVFELRIMRYLECPGCGESMMRLKRVDELPRDDRVA